MIKKLESIFSLVQLRSKEGTYLTKLRIRDAAVKEEGLIDFVHEGSLEDLLKLFYTFNGLPEWLLTQVDQQIKRQTKQVAQELTPNEKRSIAMKAKWQERKKNESIVS